MACAGEELEDEEDDLEDKEKRRRQTGGEPQAAMWMVRCAPPASVSVRTAARCCGECRPKEGATSRGRDWLEPWPGAGVNLAASLPTRAPPGASGASLSPTGLTPITRISGRTPPGPSSLLPFGQGVCRQRCRDRPTPHAEPWPAFSAGTRRMGSFASADSPLSGWA